MMRRKVAHLYSMTSIKAYESHVDDCIQLILDNFDRFAETGHAFSLDHWLQCYAFDVIGKITVSKQRGELVGNKSAKLIRYIIAVRQDDRLP